MLEFKLSETHHSQNRANTTETDRLAELNLLDTFFE